MSEYRPDKWVVLRIETEEETYRKLFGTWSGGYLYGDSWRMNSGITRVEEDENTYTFHGYSGSAYIVSKQMYGSTAYGWSMIQDIIDNSDTLGAKVFVEDADTNFMEIDYT